MAETTDRKSFGYELWDFFKKNFAVLIIAAVALFLYFKGCGGGEGGKLIKADTVRQVVYEQQPIVIMPPYTPQQSGNTVFPINIPQQYNPSGDIQKLTEQYNNLVKDYLATRTYRDSIQLKDSSGKRVGVVNLTQGVSENQLKYTQPSYQLSFPHSYTTITNTVQAPARNQVYFGGGVTSRINTPNIDAINAGLLFKNKRDLVIGFTGGYNFPAKSPTVGISLYKKISLRKD